MNSPTCHNVPGFSGLYVPFQGNVFVCPRIKGNPCQLLRLPPSWMKGNHKQKPVCFQKCNLCLINVKFKGTAKYPSPALKKSTLETRRFNSTLFVEQWLHLQGMCTCLILSILRWGLASHSCVDHGLNTHKIRIPSCTTLQKQQGKAGQVEGPSSLLWQGGGHQQRVCSQKSIIMCVSGLSYVTEELMVCWQHKTLGFEKGSSVLPARRVLECWLQGSSDGHRNASDCVRHWVPVLPQLPQKFSPIEEFLEGNLVWKKSQFYRDFCGQVWYISDGFL